MVETECAKRAVDVNCYLICFSNCHSRGLMIGASLYTHCRSWRTIKQMKRLISWTWAPQVHLILETWLLSLPIHCVNSHRHWCVMLILFSGITAKQLDTFFRYMRKVLIAAVEIEDFLRKPVARFLHVTDFSCHVCGFTLVSSVSVLTVTAVLLRMFTAASWYHNCVGEQVD